MLKWRRLSGAWCSHRRWQWPEQRIWHGPLGTATPSRSRAGGLSTPSTAPHALDTSSGTATGDGTRRRCIGSTGTATDIAADTSVGERAAPESLVPVSATHTRTQPWYTPSSSVASLEARGRRTRQQRHHRRRRQQQPRGRWCGTRRPFQSPYSSAFWGSWRAERDDESGMDAAPASASTSCMYGQSQSHRRRHYRQCGVDADTFGGSRGTPATTPRKSTDSDNESTSAPSVPVATKAAAVVEPATLGNNTSNGSAPERVPVNDNTMGMQSRSQWRRRGSHCRSRGRCGCDSAAEPAPGGYRRAHPAFCAAGHASLLPSATFRGGGDCYSGCRRVGQATGPHD